MQLERTMRSSGIWERALLSSFLIAVNAACSGTDSPDIAATVGQLDTELPAVISQGNAPSIQVAVVEGDRVIWSRAFGENASVDRVYMNASVQKVFTATAVLRLVERGRIDLDADVGEYLPFTVRHPLFPETPVTVRMLLAHRSGLDALPYQFAWDTESAFSPEYRPPCPDYLRDMSLQEFLVTSLTPEGTNYDPESWMFHPGEKYRYSVSAYPLLRYLIGQVAGASYEEYVRQNVFAPLKMTSSGFSADEFAGSHAIPHTRIDGNNVEIPVWNGQGSMMHTTAADMARFMLALMNNGRYRDYQLLRPETVDLMQRRTARFRSLFRGGEDLPRTGHGLGLFLFRGGWVGNGGSAPGFQSLLRYNPSRQVGFVIMANVNAILSGGKNYASARSDIYAVQEAVVSIQDPSFGIRRRAAEVAVLGALGTYLLAVVLRVRRRRRRSLGLASSSAV
jgi:CubicO group peptidase (beta-lactamase class C family)